MPAADGSMHAAEEVHAITDALDLQIEAKKVQMSSTTGEMSDLIHLVWYRQPCHNLYCNLPARMALPCIQYMG